MDTTTDTIVEPIGASKRCSGPCKEVKPLADFSKSTGSKDGVQRYCTSCSSMYAKRYYANKKAKEQLIKDALGGDQSNDSGTS